MSGGEAERIRELTAQRDLEPLPSFDQGGGAEDQTGDSAGMETRYVFYPAWRSQLVNVLGFLATGVLSIAISSEWATATVISGKLFSVGGHTLILYLPLTVFAPALFLGRALVNIYDAVYVVDDRGIEARIGLASLTFRQPRLRHEDIRGVEPMQSLVQRLLGTGDVLIGSAMTEGVEIIMEGVANPRGIQRLISREMEKRLRWITRYEREGRGNYVAAVRSHSD